MEFGVVTLIGNDNCGKTCANGLPSVPSPTRMLSRFSKLVCLEHPHLCKYVEFVRCHTASNGVVVISEHYQKTYFQQVSLSNSSDLLLAYFTALQVCSAIKYCHDNRIVVGLVSIDNILVDPSKPNHIKLAQYGVYHITGNNLDVDYVIGSAWYMAPERLVDNHKCAATYKSDVWSFGIVLLEIFASKRLSDIWGTKQVFSVLSAVINKANGESVLPLLLDAMQFASPSSASLPEDITIIVAKCLQILPSRRPTAAEVLYMLQDTGYNKGCLTLSKEHQMLDESIESLRARIQKENIYLECFNRPLNELFFLWKLCGSSVENILIAKGIIQMRPAMCTMPSLVVGENQMYGNEKERTIHTTFHVCVLPSKNLRKRLKSMPLFDLCHSFELDSQMGCGQGKVSSISQTSNRMQTLVVKERDIDYQVLRMRLFHQLLAVHPYKTELLRMEAAKDISPIYRASVWAILLEAVNGQHHKFSLLDTFSDTGSDRQLQVDIPRCHQYDELMTSPVAHHKLKLLLKAWLACQQETGYVYWQGLDSLAAPFLVLNFNNLNIAFNCLTAFINKYLHNFFLKDNSDTIQEYLAVFVLLLEFIDPELSHHLTNLDFQPQLFAIPWFLTCFAHVLPLHKLFHLWDSLLLTDASFPLFIGIAILIQLRPQLITAQFNDAILLFSDLPDICIDSVVASSLRFYQAIPASCVHSQHTHTRHCVASLNSQLVALINGASQIANFDNNH